MTSDSASPNSDSRSRFGPSSDLLSFLWHKFPATVAIAVLAGVAAGLMSTGTIVVINQTLAEWKDRYRFLWLFFALTALVPLFRLVSQLLLLRLSQTSMVNLRLGLSQQILDAPLRKLEKAGHARIRTALVDDVLTIIESVPAIPALFINGAIILSCLIYLLWLSPPYFAAAVTFVLLGVGGYHLLVRSSIALFDSAREKQDRLSENFHGLIDGNKELKLNSKRRQTFFEEDLTQSARGYCTDYLKATSLWFSGNIFGQFVFLTLIGVILFVMPRVTAGDPNIVAPFVLTTLFLLSPLEATLIWLPALARAKVSLARLRELGFALPRGELVERIAAPLVGAQSWRELTLIGMRYRYSDADSKDRGFELGPIELTIRRGEVIFVRGGNGSGKTTLAKLICGLYEPSAGEIELDHVKIDESNRGYFRELFSAVFTDFYLFERLPLADLNSNRVAADWLRRFQLEQKVSAVDGRLSTTRLSHGQRKRLALLNSILENRPILILDEWAADQDPMFRELFYTQIISSLRGDGKTCIVISHDEKYFCQADRLIVLEEGMIAADLTAEARICSSAY